MLLFDVTVQASVGAVYALRDREQLVNAAGRDVPTAAFRDGLLYSMLLYIPSAICFLYIWPGWNSMYLLDIETERWVGGLWTYGDIVALVLAYMGGFAWARWWLRGGRKPGHLLLQVAAMWAVVGAILVLLLWDRSFTNTSYAAFHAGSWPWFDPRWGEPDSFFGRPIMWWLLVWGVIDFAPLLYLYWRGRRRRAA